MSRSPRPAAGSLPKPHWLPVWMVVVLLIVVVYMVALRDGRAPPSASSLPVSLIALPDSHGQPSRLSRDGGALLLGNQPGTARAELRVQLPPREQHTTEDHHWVLLLSRVPVRALRVTGPDGWAPAPQRFLAPDPEEGVMPVVYLYRLPAQWQGEVRLQLEGEWLRHAALSPQVVTEAQASRYVQRATILATLTYAAMCTLAVMGLALFFAARDPGFLTYSGVCALSLLLVASFNGHLAMLGLGGGLEILGGRALNVFALAFEAVALRTIQTYSELPTQRPLLARALDVAAVALLVLAALVLGLGDRASEAVAWGMAGLWAMGGAVCSWVLAERWWHRRLPWLGLAALAVPLLVVGIVVFELTGIGWVHESLIGLFGYQITLALTTLVLGVGLIGRIAKFREERDREQRARADSERRMYREAVRTELLTALQQQLRGAREDAVQAIALRLLLEHLRRIVPADAAYGVLSGHHGRDAFQAHPAAALDPGFVRLLPRLNALRLQTAHQSDWQQPVSRPGEATPVAIEACAPLPVRAPAWGMVLLERAGSTVFHPDELAIVRELGRIAVTQIEEAFAALRLRQTAEIDALTATLNRRSVDETLARSFQQAHRNASMVSVLFVDLDHFKRINDVHGHACGDECLRSLARAMSGVLGEEDTLGRYGGEEFVVVLPGRHAEGARQLAERLRLAVEATEVIWQDHRLRLTVSIGVASRLDQEFIPQPALERADKALYAAKRAGRNRVQVAPAVFGTRAVQA